MLRPIVPLLIAAALAAPAQKYDGPRPPKPDLPYLKHADNLIPTEVVQAKEEHKRNDILYVIDGAASSARTPLVFPIFLFQSSKIDPERLGLYKMESKDGRRELLLNAKKSEVTYHLEITRLTSGNLYRIEVDDSLDPGEYSLSPEGSDEAFCFQVY